MATDRRKRSSGQVNNKAPPGAMEMLEDMHSRVVRIETRLARLMRALGFDTEGHTLPPGERSGHTG